MSTDEGIEAPAPPEVFEAAREFIEGITWGDHRKVWELLSTEGRDSVLEVAATRGMADAQVVRLREGSGSDAETDEFLADLINGLRAELAGNDLDNLQYLPDPLPTEAGRANVVVHVPLHPDLGGTLPVATLQLVSEPTQEAASGGDEAAWRVERLVPFASR